MAGTIDYGREKGLDLIFRQASGLKTHKLQGVWILPDDRQQVLLLKCQLQGIIQVQDAGSASLSKAMIAAAPLARTKVTPR